MNGRIRYLSALLISLLAVSCQAPAEYTVRGVVRLDGQPLANACVNYLPVSGKPAIATSDDAGRYLLQTPQGPRVPPGTYSVVVTANSHRRLDTSSVIPDRYGRPDESGLRITVPSQGAEAYDLELISR